MVHLHISCGQAYLAVEIIQCLYHTILLLNVKLDMNVLSKKNIKTTTNIGVCVCIDMHI